MFSIYVITNLITGKKYVGYTNDTHKRFATHRSCGKRGIGSCSKLYKSMQKHGIENFTFEIIEDHIQTLEEAKSLEIKFINEYDTYHNGYNAHPGGTGGDMSSYQTWIDSMIKLHESKSPEDYATHGMKGKTHSDEAKEKQSKARKEYWDSMSVEDLQVRSSKISGCKNGMYGKTPKNSIKIEFNGTIYDSIAEATRKTGHSANFLKKHGALL